MSDEPERVELSSTDLASEMRAAFEDLFPGVLADGVLDVGRLSQLLDIEPSVVPDGRERFGLMWAGKNDAVRSLLSPSRATLVPDLDNSVDFDTAPHVFIEGDNLEVLKLLQKAYNDEVKLIYIDPPYNTRNDFVYEDDFTDPVAAYLEYSGQVDESGRRKSASVEKSGRRHSRWLSMMFPRLVLSRNLLTSDGIIFVSIDDNEMHNLRSMMDEVFGAENFLGCVTVVSNLKGRSDDKYFATAHNYLVAYQRREFVPLGVPLPTSYLEDYGETDEAGRPFRLQGLRKRGSSARRVDRPSMYYAFYVDKASGSVALASDDTFDEVVFPRLSDGTDGRWRWGKPTAESRVGELIARQVGPERRWDIFQVDLLERDGATKRVIPKTVWDGAEVANESGTLELKKILGAKIFDNPKPIGLMRRLLEYSVSPGDLVLDFFAGSGSMAHAVLEANHLDGGGRRSLSVNLPEPTPEDSPARHGGFATVSEITAARLKAVAATMHSPNNGIRALSLAPSNFWRHDQLGADKGQLALRESTLVEGAFDERRIAVEILLSEGVRLDVPIRWSKVDESVVAIAGDVAIATSTAPSHELVTTLISLGPAVVVFLEDGFIGRDEVRANAYFACKQAGIIMKTV